MSHIGCGGCLRILCHLIGVHCTATDLIDAVAAASGNGAGALVAKEAKGTIIHKNLRQLGGLLKRTGLGKIYWRAESVPPAAKAAIDCNTGFEWFSNNRNVNVYVAKCVVPKGSPHAIAVDTDMGLIYNKDKQYAVKLSIETLWACSGVY